MKKLLLLSLLLIPFLFAEPAFAQLGDVCEVPGAGDTEFCGETPPPGSSATNNRVLDVLNIVVDVLLFAVGSISVITIIIGSIQYTTAAGDASRAAKARSTIIYSVVAIVTAVLARSIIVFVLDRI